MRILPLLLRLAAASFLLLAVSVTGALAHAGLISADPAGGAVLGTPPPAVTLAFNEPVSPIGFSLIGVGQPARPLTDVRADGAALSVALPTDLAEGSYLFSWRVTSSDGHPLNGTVGFAIGKPSGTLVAAPSDPSLVLAIWLSRAAQYMALFLGIGSLAFGLVARVPDRARRIATGLVAGGLVLAPLAVALQGVDLLGLSFTGLLSPTAWSAGLASSYGTTQMLLVAAFGTALVGRMTRRRPVLAIAAGLGILAPVLSGHASTAEPRILMRSAVALHLIGLMFWLGALLPLFLFLRDGSAEAQAALRRFSRIVPLAVAALLASGVTLAIVQLGPLDAYWFSAYGLILGAKLVLVALLLGLALVNRLWFTRPVLGGEARSRVRLRRSIVAELLLVLALLGIVAGWRFTPPPRVLAEIAQMQAPATAPLSGATAMGTLEVHPGRPGPVTLKLHLTDHAGAPLNARTVVLKLSNPAAGIATISVPAKAAGDGWTVADLMLPAGGDWPVEVEARTGDFDLSVLKGTLTLAPPSPEKETKMSRSSSLAAIVASSLMLSAPQPALAQSGLLDSCATGQMFAAGDISVTGAFVRATPKGAQSAGGYLTLRNSGSAADTFTGASSGAASDVTLHQMKMKGTVMEMAAVEGGLEVPAGGTVALEPMGYHLMLTGMPAPLVEGQCVQMVLHFAHAGDVPIELNIGSRAQMVPPGGDSDPSMEMDMSGMSSMEGM
jgi:copper transport protein